MCYLATHHQPRSWRYHSDRGWCVQIPCSHCLHPAHGDLADGVVRLYRNYDPSLSNGPVQMVSSFRGASEVLHVQRGSGVITDWRQTGGTLLVGGDSRVVRVWDAHTESQVMVSVLEPHCLHSLR